MFQFKQFNIKQDKTAMKISTDAVLLGAWTNLNNAESILDIGAGTGVLALMLAQRSDAEIIDAVEIEDNAYEQCVENFEQSNWADRLFCYHANFNDFAVEIHNEQTYDLIISNPPFYTETFESNIKSRAMARSTSTLPFKKLLKEVTMLLSEKGIFSVIIPTKEETTFLNLAEKENLYPKRKCIVFDNPSSSKSKRILLTFSKNKSNIKEETIILKTADKQFSDEYIHLTKKYYLKL